MLPQKKCFLLNKILTKADKMISIADDIDKKWIPGPVVVISSGKEKFY